MVVRENLGFKGMCNKGFSLIELSIALVVIGLLVTPFLQQYNNFIMTNRVEQGQGAIVTVSAATGDFLEANGRYPCPADPRLVPGDVGHGVEICPPIMPAGPAPGVCPPGSPLPPGGICRTLGRDADGFGGGDPILIGAVPYVTLGITIDSTIDGWSRKLAYVVTESLASDQRPYDVLPHNDAWGAISVENEFGSSKVNVVLGPGGQPFVLVSYGENGAGAYTTSGALVAPCPAIGTEVENCDNDDLFIALNTAKSRYMAPGVNYIDDMVSTLLLTNQGIWSNSAVAPTVEDINTTNLGNVGIGVLDPEYRLDVGGNIKAKDVHSDEYCDASGGNCFPPEVIGGTGMECDDFAGQEEAMTGIASTESVCELVIPPTIITGVGTCPAGKYMIGISGTGDAICAAP